MENKFTLVATFIFMLLISCSNNKEESIDISDSIPTTYLPLTTNNFWNYDVSSTYNGNITLSKDSLHVGNDILLNAISYKKMFSEGKEPVGNSTGFYSSILNNNDIRIDGSKLRLSGTVNLPTIISDPIALNLNDFIIFKENATSGTELSSVSGSFVRTIQTYPLTFNYTFKSVADTNLSTYTSNGITYNDIRKTKLILNLTVTYNTTTSGGIPITLFVLPAQDVIVSTQYYSKNTGVIYNSTSINYSMNTSVVSSLNLPSNTPTSSSITQEEFLKNYYIY